MADRRSTITLAIADEFSANLAKYSTGMQAAAGASAQLATASPAISTAMGQAANSTGALAQATHSMSSATTELSGHQTNLHQILGVSRREAGYLEQSLLSLTGVSGGLGQGISALMSGIGPMGLALTGLSLAVGIVKGSIDSYNKTIEEAAKKEMEWAKVREEHPLEAGAMNRNKVALEENAKALETLTKRAAELRTELKNPLELEQAGGAGARAIQEELDGVLTSIDQLIKQQKTLSDNPFITPGHIDEFREGTNAADNFRASIIGILNAQNALANDTAARKAVGGAGAFQEYGEGDQAAMDASRYNYQMQKANASYFAKPAAGGAASHATGGGDGAHAMASGAMNFMPGGRDFAKEMEALFSEQSGMIQGNFVGASGGNKDKAIDEWRSQHKAELLGQLLQNPSQFVNAQGPYAGIQGALGGTGILGGAGGSTGPGGVSTGMAGDTAKELGHTDIGGALLKAVDASKDAIAKAGKTSAQAFIGGFTGEIDSEGDEIGSALARAVTSIGDGRYVKLAKNSYGYTP